MKAAGIWMDDHYAVILIDSDSSHKKFEVWLERDRALFCKDSTSPKWKKSKINQRPPENHLKRFYDTILEIVENLDEVHLCGPGFSKHAIQRELIAGNKVDHSNISIHCSQQLPKKEIIKDLKHHMEHH